MRRTGKARRFAARPARWTLNITRADMIAAGYSPSVRLFEASLRHPDRFRLVERARIDLPAGTGDRDCALDR